MSYTLTIIEEDTGESLFCEGGIEKLDDLHEEIEREIGYVPADLLDVSKDEWLAGTWAARDLEHRDVLVDVEGAEVS